MSRRKDEWKGRGRLGREEERRVSDGRREMKKKRKTGLDLFMKEANGPGSEGKVGSFRRSREEDEVKDLKRRKNIDRHVLRNLNIISTLPPGLNSYSAKKVLCTPRCTFA